MLPMMNLDADFNSLRRPFGNPFLPRVPASPLVTQPSTPYVPPKVQTVAAPAPHPMAHPIDPVVPRPVLPQPMMQPYLGPLASGFGSLFTPGAAHNTSLFNPFTYL